MANCGAAAQISIALLGWIALGSALVRSAERRVATAPLPAPWRSLAIALTLVALALYVRPEPQAALCAVACTMLVLASGADYRTGYLFDAITLPAAAIVGTLAAVTQTTTAAAWGVALLVGSFGAVVLFTRGRMLGLGDVKAMYTLGAAFGPLESLIAVFVAAVSGIVTVAVTRRLRRGSDLYFGPHLAVGSAFTLVAGGPLAHRLMGT